MASIQYSRVPLPTLQNLTRADLTVLDLALAHMKDMLNDDPDGLGPIDLVALDHLHCLVLEIKRGEEVTE